MSRRRLLGAGLGVAGLTAVSLASGTAAAAAPVPSTTLPARADILAAIRRVNDHWIGATSASVDNQWNAATYASGAMAAYRATGEKRYLDRVAAWAQFNNYGLHNGTTTRNADDHTAGQVYYDLYDVDPDPAKLTAINESIRLMVYGSQANKNDDWWWVDALHMAMPVFVRVAAYQRDEAYLRKLYTMYQHTKKTVKLYDYSRELWYRDSRYLPGGPRALSPNRLPVFWSRGNGWAIAAHAKTLALLPAGDNRWPEYTFNMQGLARTLRATQRADGFYNVNLTDPNHFGGPESSGTALFAYGLAYGIRTGVLDRATYLPVAAKAWNGILATAVRADGLLGYVQRIGEDPASSQPVTADSTADFGVGAFLLAGSELAKLAG